MKPANKKHDCDTFQDLAIAYMEELLSTEETEAFQAHLLQCSHCAAHLEETRLWSGFLEENIDEVCPELWKIFEGHEREAVNLNEHIAGCGQCSEDLKSFQSPAEAKEIPEGLWREMTSSVHKESKPAFGVKISHYVEQAMDYVRETLWAPSLAFATVAAALIIAVMLYPTFQSDEFIGLSDTQWSSVAIKRQLLGPAQNGPIAGLLIKYSGLKDKPEQEMTDSLYQALEPKGRLEEQYQWLTPDEVKSALSGVDLESAPNSEIFKNLSKELQASNMALLKISKTDRAYDLSVALYDTNTGRVLKQAAKENVGKTDLIKEAKGLFFGMSKQD
jgi:hypothetical protein